MANPPPAFYMAVALIELLGVLTSMFISYFGFKAYKLLKDKKFLYFSFGFLFISLNSLAHAALNLILNLDFADFLWANKLNPIVASLFGVYYLFVIMVMLAYTSFIIMYSNLEKRAIVILLYLLTFLVGTFYFQSYYKFNFVSAILLSFVVYYTGKNYLKKKSTNSLLVFGSFVLMVISHLLALVQTYLGTLYIVSYLFLLAGFILLLSMLLRSYLNARKKN